MFIFRSLAFALLIFLWSPSLLTAQSVLQFPRAISSAGVYTGIAVGNPTTTEAAVTFVAFQPDGSLLGGGAQNPVTVIIPAGGQSARLVSEIFGPVDFNGWVQATSSTSGLTGFFINGNSNLTDFDGAGSRSPGTEFVLPLAVEDATARTEVTLVNVNPDAAVVSVTVYAGDGRVILAKDISLPARNLRRQTLVNLLGAADFSAASHLTLRANRPIIAHEVVADFQIPGTGLRRETGALPGHALTSTALQVLPQFATGGSWTSVVGLVNGSNVAKEVTLTAYKEDGSLWSVPSNPKKVTLPGNGGIRETVENLFGFPPDTLNTGWILVSPSQGELATYIGYGNTLTPSFALVEGVEIGTAARFSVFSQVAEGAGFYTGLTVVNPGPTSADIEFYTLRADGSSVGRTTLTLAPNQKVARLFRELLPVSFEQVGGWGYVRSTSPVVAAVLFGSTNGYALASVPQQIPAGDFVPPAQTSGAITGTVRSGGNGIANVQITLSGPVNTSITTESSGRFVFSRLPAGQYKVTASRTGAVILPVERNVTIDRQNVGGIDFDAGGVTPANLPRIDFISPVSTFAGNRALSIRVFGTNFTPVSVVRVNGQVIPTVVEKSTELSAVIPASSLTQPTILKVTLETPPPGGGISSAVDFTVNPAPSSPLIEGSATVGLFPAGVAIDATRRHALITSQSTNSVTVLDLVTRTTVTAVPVGRSPGEGIDIHPGKDIALVANVGTNDVSVIDLKTNAVSQTIKVGRGPLGLAINPETNRAYVVNGDEDNITVINLDTLTSIGVIAAGSRPSSIAINTRTNQAIVSNRGANSVSLLSLATGSVLATINVGESPRGVAINPDTNRGVVANAGSNSISILDLVAMTAVPVTVGPGPTGVAIHRGTNSVLVTNSGVTTTTPGFGGVSTVSIINLDRREEVASVPAGSAAFGIAVDQDRQVAAAVNFGSNDVTIFRIPNPVPRITGVEPKAFPTGGGSFVVTVRGTGFVPTSVITLNRQTLPTSFVSSTELRGVVSAALVDQLLQVRSAVTAGTGKGTISPAVVPVEFNIGVENPGPGGGDSPPPADPQTTHINPQNPLPALLSLSPTETLAGVADLTLTLSGNNFNATSIINFGGTQFSPVSSSLQSMTVVVPRAQLVAGVFQVSVTNPSPGGGLSALLPFTVNGQANPGPTVSTVTPSSVPAGSGAVTVVVEGTGFMSSTTGTLAGVSGVLSGGTMSFALSASQTALAGTLSGLISNPAPGGGTATFAVNVLNPAPTVSAFTPSSSAIGASAVSLQVTGTNFVANSEVTFGGTPIATAFVSSNLLTATIPATLLTASGSFAIGVTNDGPGGGSAQGGNFAVLPPPTLSSVSPSSGVQGTVVSVTLAGTNFVPGATTIAVSGDGVTVGSIAAGASSSSLSTSFTISPTATPGPRNVTVSTAGGTSTAAIFTVVLAPPTLSSISPASGKQGAVVSVTLAGTNFVAGSTVSISSTGVTVGPVTVVSLTSISTTLTISPTATVGPRSVTVTTAGGVSGAATFSVEPAVPTLLSVSPAFGIQGTVVSVTLTGTNFAEGSTVSTNSSDVTVGPVTVVSPTSIATTFTISPTATVGSRSVTVTTSSGTSGDVTFSVEPAPPTLSSISPDSGVQGAVVSVTLTGTNFTAGSSVSVSSIDISVGAVTVHSPTSITTTFTISPTAAMGARSVSVNTSGGTSGTVTFTVNPAVPTLTSINPASGIQGAVVGVTITGTNFTAGSTVSVSGTGVTVGPVTVVNLTSITTTFTISPTAALGARNVSVTSAGGTIGGVTFTVDPAAPTLSSVSPASGIQGAAVGVTLTGTNFIAGAAVSVSGTGVTVGPVTVVSPTSITTTLTISPTAALGARNVSVNTSGGTSGTVTFTVDPAAPTLSSVSPASGIQGAAVGVTLTGTNFIAGAAVSVSGTGVTVGSVTVVSPTSITTTLTISPTAALGARSVSVNTAGGTSGTVTFTVDPAAPTLSSVSPASGIQGAAVGVTLTGTNFIAGAAVSVSGTGVTVGPVTVVSPTSITTTLTISPTAALGARSVSVNTAGGTSGTVTFTVDPAAPTLSSVSPSTGLQGDVVPVTLTGTNFLAGATVAVSGTGVAVSAVNVVNSTTLTATLTINSLAASGARNVTVTTAAGISGPVTFTVVAGANLVTGFSGAANPGGVWSYGFTPTLGGVLSLYDSNAATLPPGFQQWYSSSGGGGTPGLVRNNTGSDYIDTNNILIPANMVLTHPGPSGQYSVIRWTSPATGAYAIQGAFMGLDQHPTTSDVHVRHNSSMDLFTANINNYNVPVPFSVIVSVLAGDTIDFAAGFGSNLDYGFDSTGVSGTITPLSTVPLPSLSAISPASGIAGATTSVTLTGTNFVSGGTTVAVSGADVTVGAVNVVSSTSLTVSLAIAPAAATGARSVTVTTVGGTSNPQTFTINPGAPTLTSISPSSGSEGTDVPVTLTGTNFVAGATTVAVSGGGVSVGAVTVLSPTSLTTTFTIPTQSGISVPGDDGGGVYSGSAIGVYNVTVTTASGTSGSVPFSVVPSFPGSVFTGAVSTNWSDPANWQPAGVPTASTTVLIPATAARQPTLTASVSVLNLTVENGATLNTAGFNVAVLGNVDAGSTIIGTGTVVMSGSGTIRGTLPNVLVTGTAGFAPASTSTINGSLTINGGHLDLASATVTVTGNFSTTSSGVLSMVDPAGVLTINGATLFDGGNTVAQLTGGTLNALGSFTSSSSSFTNFAASGTHLTVLNGTAAQIVSVNFPGPASNRFQNLRLSNPAGVVFSTNTQINGNFDVTVAASVSGSSTVTIVGNLTTAAGSTVTTAGMTLGGAMTVGGTFTPGTTTFVGTSQTIQAGLGYQNVVVTGAAAFASTTTVTGNLNVSGGLVDLAGAAVTVTGNFSTTASGVLRMQNPAGVLTINGTTLFDGGNTVAQLTAGTLNVLGSFTSSSSSFTNFAASGTHLTVLNGPAAQIVSVNFPGPASNRFQNLRLTNPAGVVFSTNTQINGNFDVMVAAGVSGAGTVTVDGNLSTPPGSTVTTTGMTLGGAMTVGGTFTPGTTTFVGTSQTIQAGLGYQNVVVTGTAAFASTTTVTGNLNVAGGLIDVAGATVTVTGNFSTTVSGVLRMQNPAGVLTINGTTLFDGGNTVAQLTAGTLNVLGSFTSSSSSFTNFAASGTHLTVLNGTAAQTVSVNFPGPASNRFQNLRLTNPAGVVFSTNTQINGNFDVMVAAGVSGAGTVAVDGNLTTPSGSTVTTTGMTLRGTMTVGGTFTPATTTFAGTGQTIQAGLGYQNVVVTGTAAFMSMQTFDQLQATASYRGIVAHEFLPPAFTAVTGNLSVPGGLVDITGATVTVTGNFSTTAGGVLRMQNPAGVLNIYGTTLFGGGSTVGELTAGTLNLRGNFNSDSSSFTNFAASGTHLTVLNGTASQLVSTNFPGGASNRFQNLRLTNAAGAVFSTNTQINGNFDVMAAAPVSGAGTLTIAGNLTTSSGSTVTTAGITLGGAMLVNGGFSPITTTFAGVSQTIQAGLAYQNVVVAGTAAFQTSQATLMLGSLTVLGGQLTVPDAIGFVTGNFATTGGGVLIMRDDNGILSVNGNVTFDGGNTPGSLTAGTLLVRGNFTATSSSFTNFPASGTHLTILDGTSLQTVTVNNPGVTNNRFQDLLVTNINGVSLGSNVVVAGTLTAYETSAKQKIIGNGRSLTVTGIDVDGLDLDNVRLVINWDGLSSFYFNNVDFRNYPDAATRITLTAPYLGEASFYGLNFVDGVPTSGILVNATDTNGGDDFYLYISSNLNAGLAEARTVEAGGASVYWSSPPAHFLSAVNYNVGTSPRSIDKADFNGDGNLDLVVSNYTTNDVSILLGNGSGGFQTAVNYTTASGRGASRPTFVKTGDFNLDGRVDLAVANENTDDVSILLGNGNGTFQAAVHYAVNGDGPGSLAVGDFNGDGRPDLVVTTELNDGPDTLSTLLGNGNGTFQSAVTLPAGDTPRSVVVADFNADGRQDLAVANAGNSNLSVYLGNGNGTFQTRVNYAAGFSPYSLVSSDFNRDGRPDLAVANRNEDSVYVYFGNGNGTFQTAASYATGSSPRSLIAGDFNADGVQDLATADCGSACGQGFDRVSILLGVGDGTFQYPIQYLAGAAPFAVVGGDFNADGRTDLAVVNRDSNNVSVLLSAVLPDNF